jgi:hypothetical protein
VRLGILALVFSVMAFGQITVSGGIKVAGSVSIGSSAVTPQLPTTWAGIHESIDGPFAATKYIGNGASSCPLNTASACDYFCSDFTCLQQVITDHCSSPTQRWLAVVTHNALFTAAGPLTLTACSTKQTAAVVFRSDAPLAAESATINNIPCVNGIQDNIAGATDIYTRNQGCASGTFLTANAWHITYTLNGNNGGATNGILAQTVDVNGNGPSWYVFEDLELYPSVGGSHSSTPFQLNSGGTTDAAFASHIWCNRCYVHGDATDSGVGVNFIANYFDMECKFCGVENSFADGGIWPGSESHAIQTGFSTGPAKYVHNVMEGESSSYFTGGLAQPPGQPLPSMQDAEVRRNRFTYPAAWLGNGSGGGKCGAQSCVRKNGLEHKGMLREVIAGNYIENVDSSGGQNGPAMNLNVRASSVNNQDDYTQTISDITIEANIFRNICRGVGWDGRGGQVGGGQGVDSGMARVLFQNNLLYNNGLTQPGCSAASTPVPVKIDASGHNWTGYTVTRDGTGTIATLQLSIGATKAINTISRTSNVTSVTINSTFPMIPVAASSIDIEGVLPTSFNGVHLVCVPPTTGCANPTNNSFTITDTNSNASGSGGTAESFVGEAQTGVSAGDPVWVSGCTDTTFNAGPSPFVIAIAPTIATGTTIVYPNAGTANASTTCNFSNALGWPRYLTLVHNTIVGDVRSCAPGNGNTVGNAAYSRNVSIYNDIFNGCGMRADNAGAEGTTTENGFYDTKTLVLHHNVHADRIASAWASGTVYRLGDRVHPTGSPSHQYIAVTNGTSGGSQPAFSGTQNSCVTDNTVTWQEAGLLLPSGPGYTEYDIPGATGVTPPTTISFPNFSYCYGATADATCIGFKGGLSSPTTGTNACSGQVASSSIQQVFDLANWTNYALDSSSTFHNSASDGTDIGADFTKINAAQTAGQYVCSTPCGSGSKPD